MMDRISFFLFSLRNLVFRIRMRLAALLLQREYAANPVPREFNALEADDFVEVASYIRR
jgi:hypothetical protein